MITIFPNLKFPNSAQHTSTNRQAQTLNISHAYSLLHSHRPIQIADDNDMEWCAGNADSRSVAKTRLKLAE